MKCKLMAYIIPTSIFYSTFTTHHQKKEKEKKKEVFVRSYWLSL